MVGSEGAQICALVQSKTADERPAAPVSIEAREYVRARADVELTVARLRFAHDALVDAVCVLRVDHGASWSDVYGNAGMRDTARRDYGSAADLYSVGAYVTAEERDAGVTWSQKFGDVMLDLVRHVDSA